MTTTRVRVLMASTVHRWNDVRIYYKEALSLAKVADIHLVAVQVPDQGEVPNGAITVELLSSRGRRPGIETSALLRFRRLGQMLNIVLRRKYDVFHFHDPELIPVGWFAKLRGKKVIYDMHEDALHLLARRRWMPRLLGRWVGVIIRGFELLSLLIFDRFVLAEKAYADVFKAKKCYTVLNHPLIDQPFEPRRRHDGESLRTVYVGSLTGARGTEDILRGVRDLSRSGMNITLDLYGVVGEQDIDELIRRHVGEEWLTFHGWIPGDTIVGELRKYHIGLSPLRDHRGYRDIWPTKILEYIVSGLAIVASRLPGTSHLLKDLDCAAFHSPGDVEALKETLVSLADEDKRMTMASNGNRLIQRYSWASQEQVLLQLYSGMLHQEN